MQSYSQIVTTNKPTPNFLQAGCPSSITWGCNSPNKLKSLVVLQKRLYELLPKQNFGHIPLPLFKKYNLLKIMDICQFQIALFIFKFTISKLPSMFNSYFTYTSSIHHYSTGLDWFFLIPEDQRPKAATPLHAMLLCPVQFSRTHPLVIRSSL